MSLKPDGTKPNLPAEPNKAGRASKGVKELQTKNIERRSAKVTGKSEKDRNMNRVLWERSRIDRVVLACLVQAVVWINLFGFDRGFFTGPYVIITVLIVAIVLTYLLISITRFGNIFDIAFMLLYGLLTILGEFSTLYWNYGNPGNFTENLTRLDAVYFSVGILSTAGTGNISAVSQLARGLQIMQMLMDISFIVIALSLAVAKISAQMQDGHH